LHKIFFTKLAIFFKQIKRRIQHLDQEIDNLVYQLYDLNETEIALIEGENV